MGRGAREQESSAFLLLLLLLLPPPSLLPVFFFSRSVRRDPRPLTRHTKRLTYARARERALSKKRKRKKKKRREKEKRKREWERKKKTRGADTSELLLVEKLEVFARCVSKQFCLLIGGVKGRKATPTLPSPPLPRLRNYRRAVLFERLSLPGAGIKDVNARHLASLQGKSAGTAFHSGVNLMKRSFHLSRAPL